MSTDCIFLEILSVPRAKYWAVDKYNRQINTRTSANIWIFHQIQTRRRTVNGIESERDAFRRLRMEKLHSQWQFIHTSAYDVLSNSETTKSRQRSKRKKK